MSTPTRSLRRDAAGYSLVELLVALGVTTVIMGATMVGLTDALRANDSVVQITGMNQMLRASMDLMVLDLMQAGAGVPPSHTIDKPSGAGALGVLLPGPPGSEFTPQFTSAAGNAAVPAVMPGPGFGPTVNGAVTDTIGVLVVDADVDTMSVSAVTATTVDVTVATWNAAYRIAPGQLMMLSKSSGGQLRTSLAQVTNVDSANRRLTFASGDSLRLNQPAAAAGSLAALNALAPANSAAAIRVQRVRLITYYLDAVTNPNRPRLVRRINNGHQTNFDNDLGTAVGLDIENLQLSYDIAVGNAIQSNVEAPADATLIRKVNVTLSARSKNTGAGSDRIFRNTLSTQISLRGMALADRYLAPQ